MQRLFPTTKTSYWRFGWWGVWKNREWSHHFFLLPMKSSPIFTWYIFLSFSGPFFGFMAFKRGCRRERCVKIKLGWKKLSGYKQRFFLSILHVKYCQFWYDMTVQLCKLCEKYQPWYSHTYMQFNLKKYWQLLHKTLNIQRSIFFLIFKYSNRQSCERKLWHKK